MSKTMPVRWQDKTIVVLEDRKEVGGGTPVFIEAPYGVDDCRASPDHQVALARVKKVLQAERQRLDAAAAANGGI